MAEVSAIFKDLTNARLVFLIIFPHLISQTGPWGWEKTQMDHGERPSPTPKLTKQEVEYAWCGNITRVDEHRLWCVACGC